MYPQSDKPPWEAVIRLRYLLHAVKDYEGFECLFGEENTVAHRGSEKAALKVAASIGISGGDDSIHFYPLAPQRGLPEDVSAQVKAEYAQSDGGAKQMPPCDVITSTPAEWIGWREITQTDWEKMGKQTDSPLPEVYRNEQGELVYRFWVKRISRPPASWLSWQEFKHVDWEEEVEWIDRHIYEYRRNEQGELILHPAFASIWEVKRQVGCEQIDFSTEQEWDLGNVVYRIKKVRMKRKEVVMHWENVFKTLDMLAENYGDEGVRVIAWLD